MHTAFLALPLLPERAVDGPSQQAFIRLLASTSAYQTGEGPAKNNPRAGPPAKIGRHKHTFRLNRQRTHFVGRYPGLAVIGQQADGAENLALMSRRQTILKQLQDKHAGDGFADTGDAHHGVGRDGNAGIRIRPAETLPEDNAPCASHAESGPRDVKFVEGLVADNFNASTPS